MLTSASLSQCDEGRLYEGEAITLTKQLGDVDEVYEIKRHNNRLAPIKRVCAMI